MAQGAPNDESAWEEYIGATYRNTFFIETGQKSGELKSENERGTEK